MSRNESVPLGQITIRQWELTRHSTRYDRLQAAPSDEQLETMWLVWIVVSSVVAIGVGTVLLGLLADRKARQNPFNLYLVFLMVPDVLFSFFMPHIRDCSLAFTPFYGFPESLGQWCVWVKIGEL